MCMCLPIGLCIDYAYFFDSFMHQLFPRIVMCTHYFLSIYARILVCMHARIYVFIFTCLCIDYLFSFFSLGVVGGGCFLSSLWGVGFQPPPGFGHISGGLFQADVVKPLADTQDSRWSKVACGEFQQHCCGFITLALHAIRV